MSGFGGAVKLTGESEYRKALAQITQSLRETSSEMKLVSSSFDKNDKSVSALSAQMKALNNVLTEQKSKVDTLKAQYASMSAQFQQQTANHNKLVSTYNAEKAKLDEIGRTLGTTSKEYQDQASKVSDLSQAVTKSTQAQDANEKSLSKLRTEINKAETDCNNTSREMKNLGKSTLEADEGFTVLKGTLANLYADAIKKVGEGLKNLASELVNVGKQSFNAYAEFEQLSGGVKKIFDEMDYATIAKDAQEAYKTMGISASQYLQIMTTVGANFASTLGDAKGYEVAKEGMQAITDFATGTGKSIEELSSKYQLIVKSTSSYQSIADQFAGILPATSASFLEQAQAVGFLSDKYTKLTEVPIDEYQEAVTKMLTKGVEDIGLASNTVMEAETTISGSLGAMKASWENLITALGDPDADLGELVDTFVETAITAGKNAIPKIREIMEGMGEVFSQLWNEVLPELKEQVPELEPLISALQWVKDNGDLIISILAGITAGIVAFKVASALSTVISSFTTFFGLIQSGTGIMGALNAVMAINPFALIVAGIAVLVTAFATLWKTSDEFREFWIDLWDNIKTFFSDTWESISKFFTDTIPNAFRNAKESLVNWMSETIGKIKDWARQTKEKAIETGREFLNNIIDFFKQLPEKVWSWLTSTAGKVKDFATDMAKKAKDGAKETFDNIVDKLKELPSEMLSVGSDLVTGLWNGITGMGSWIKDKISGFASGLVEKFKSAFKIGSPSKIMADQVGQYLAQGIGVGFEDEMGDIARDMQDAIPTSFDLNPTVNGARYGSDSSLDMVSAFKEALSQMMVVMDDEQMGKFVENTVARAIYA